MLMKHENIIDTGVSKRTGNVLTLYHAKACEVPAGSGTRQDKEHYGVLIQFYGGRHGHKYKTLEEAKTCFDKWISE